MKLSTKISFFVIIFFSVIFLVGGYALIAYYYEISMEREVEAAAEQYQYNKFVLQSALITRKEEWYKSVIYGEQEFDGIASDMSHTVAIYSLEGDRLYSEFPTDFELGDLIAEIKDGAVSYQFGNVNNRMQILMAGKVLQKETGLYLITGMDVERVLEQQEQIIQKFGTVYGISLCTGILLIIILSSILTRPIKQLTEATKEIADGYYQKRIQVSSEDEVGQLARNFNQMTEAIEEKVQELSDSARQKEDFVANFAHELKTPLTSIIGYANRIYQKELTREEQRKAALYIWNEGMRLESLSFKLMDLTVLNHKEFDLRRMLVGELFQELEKSTEYFLEEKNVRLFFKAEPAFIDVEYDLFQTMIINLIDNSIKAGADKLVLKGYLVSKQKYVIQLKDNGSGIPQSEIKRITEAFYMVDKSRSRKQHGAGIGLALAEKIAEIHGSSLEFESDGESGTRVSICLTCKGDETDE